MPPTWRIRTAVADDAGPLAVLARATYVHAYADEVDPLQLQAHLEQELADDAIAQMLARDRFYLAVGGETTVGFVQIGQVTASYREHVAGFDPQGSEIRRLYVAHTHQNLGIGTRLIERADRDPHIAQTRTTYLTTWETNHGAQRLYRRAGFRKVGQFPEFGDDGAINGYEHIMARANPS